jgi:GntR family transcriptional repressor for pyruvate dehydrogenase complex
LEESAAVVTRFQAVKKTRVYEEIVSQITSLILEGKLSVGDKLPSERELCERFGVGRNSVREATRALESAGLVDTRQGEGTFVTTSPESLLSPLSQKISSEGEDGIRHLFEARRILEPQIASLAAVRCTDEEIERLEAVLKRQRGEVNDGGSGMDEDTAFHLALARAAKNEFLLRLVDILLDSLCEMRERSVRDKGGRIRSLEGHEEILAAVKDRNERRALALMLAHLLEVEGREVVDPAVEAAGSSVIN